MWRSQLTTPIVIIRDPLLRQPFARWCAIIAAALLAGAWIAILGIPNAPGSAGVIIHYTTTFGIDALGSWADLLRLPLTGTALLAVNVALARFFVRLEISDRRLRVGEISSSTVSILLVASVALEFMVFVGAVLLRKVNG